MELVLTRLIEGEYLEADSVQSIMKRWMLPGVLSLLFGVAVPAPGAGFIIVDDGHWLPQPIPPYRPPPWPPRPLPPIRPHQFAPLEVGSVRVNTRIADQVAVTSVDEEFYNPNAARLEGTFIFPVPKGAHIDKFTMEIDGRQVEAELLSADKARQIYEDIVRRLKDPALLEYAGRDVFKVRIFPIEPNSKKRVSLSYTQLLKSDDGLISYVLPLSTEKFSAKPIRQVECKSGVGVQKTDQINLLTQPFCRSEASRVQSCHCWVRSERGTARQ